MTEDGPVYLDYHATTPVDPRVAEVVMRYMTEEFGNANSSEHVFGDAAQAAVATAREHVARLVGADPSQVVFTSGATESIFLAIHGFVRKLQALGVNRPLRVALPPVEHQAVLRCCEALAESGDIQLAILPVDSRARIDLGDLERLCKDGQDLVCLMMANNEVGNLYPVAEAAAIAVESGAFFLCDATQAVGRVPIKFSRCHIDALALSGHKFYGPKGVGALLLSNRFPIQGPNSSSGRSSLRQGTQNVSGIAGLGEAARLRAQEMTSDEPRIRSLRNRLETLLTQSIPDTIVNGDTTKRLSGNLHLSIRGVPNHALIARIRDCLAVSTGAACSSGIEAPSHVLRAMGLAPDRSETALRIGIGKFTSDRDVTFAAKAIEEGVLQVRYALGRPTSPGRAS